MALRKPRPACWKNPGESLPAHSLKIPVGHSADQPRRALQQQQQQQLSGRASEDSLVGMADDVGVGVGTSAEEDDSTDGEEDGQFPGEGEGEGDGDGDGRREREQKGDEEENVVEELGAQEVKTEAMETEEGAGNKGGGWEGGGGGSNSADDQGGITDAEMQEERQARHEEALRYVAQLQEPDWSGSSPSTYL